MIEAMVNTPIEKAADSDEAFVFPQGIAGFPDAKTFGFIYPGQGDVACMQSIDAPEAAFLLTLWDQKRLGAPPKVNTEMRKCLHLENKHDLLWMLVLNPFADKEWVTANLRAPVALNQKRRYGLQHIRIDATFSLRYQWMPHPKKKGGV
ncbi:MAG: flagellar assembly protein FliW [Mariprofundaceae bacterium]